MDSIKIDATERSPAIDFDFDGNVFQISGESYPEDVTAFYGSLMETLEAHLAEQKGATISFTFSLIYFNSSTAKILMGLFEMFDEAGENNDVTVTWNYEAEDDNMQEMGEEFGEDLENAKFVLNEVAAN
ncbi:DUF1987 domain-containing protein [Magnetovibrio blakemorei]|uniref:Fe-S oxidoreductase n=1 Tax=Magnetovibrio blakemorei TaxID=28181 RepID=A0A1E5QB82_9PROT|nr:DUF1987 domain-containing protein [Magnetovibrio blakemorei]OEJ69211.1 Fe-S oxidoreductase [Magnetovibrio blakemorei]